MKKRLILAAMAAIMAMTVAIAQQIAVVTEGGETDVYMTFPEAIEGAGPGSVIYLPGGVYGISDDVKITKRLTIIGIGNKANNDNVDGFTKIAGSLWFNEGSSGSAVMGCYITGDVNIGSGDAAVDNILIKFCNLCSVQVKNSSCEGTTINQNLLRGHSKLSWAGATFTNNVMWDFSYVSGGIFTNNIIYYGLWFLNNVNYSTFTNNVIKRNEGTASTNNANGSYVGNTFYNNLSQCQWGPSDIIESNWDDLFVNFHGLYNVDDINNDYHFSEAYQQYNGIGIYGGTGFNDHQTAPVPYIVAKRIAEETDAAGQLKIQVRVKSGD